MRILLELSAKERDTIIHALTSYSRYLDNEQNNAIKNGARNQVSELIDTEIESVAKLLDEFNK